MDARTRTSSVIDAVIWMTLSARIGQHDFVKKKKFLGVSHQRATFSPPKINQCSMGTANEKHLARWRLSGAEEEHVPRLSDPV